MRGELIYDILKRFDSIMEHIEVHDAEKWSYQASVLGDSNVLRFRLICRLPDTVKLAYGELTTKEKQEGRWWYMSADDMKDHEHVIRCVWMAYEAFMKHEMMERFRYQGALVFNPHQSIFQ